MSESGTEKKMEMPKHGEICWKELATNNTEAAQAFYSALFGWSFKDISTPEMAYTEIKQDEDAEHFGGMYKITPEMGETPPHWMNYVSVDDIDASTAKAEELGATVLMPPTDIPGTGRFSMIADPTGAAIAMITLSN